jgi:hypothetical protein
MSMSRQIDEVVDVLQGMIADRRSNPYVLGIASEMMRIRRGRIS